MTQPGRREQHKAATRRALEDAALRMFASTGFTQTTVRDIASARPPAAAGYRIGGLSRAKPA